VIDIECEGGALLADPLILPADSADEIEAAANELYQRNIDSAPVLVGEAPDTVSTGYRVFAAAPRVLA